MSNFYFDNQFLHVPGVPDKIVVNGGDRKIISMCYVQNVYGRLDNISIL